MPEIIWDRRSEEGGLKYLTIRKAQNANDGILIFTFTDGYESHPSMENFRNLCLNSLTQESLLFCYNRPKSEVSAFGRPEILRGKSTFIESVLGKSFEIPFDSFSNPIPMVFCQSFRLLKNFYQKREKI